MKHSTTQQTDNNSRPMAKYYLNQLNGDKSKLHRLALTLLIGLCQF
ncbi:hypothetical protein MD535_12330 [Vibrio sp. ZSDZ65]|uniref:Uncharacterized protein n=1 Tax=Vibrio qingdaonensis TaxID=2829491 RepID=A0A9X3CNQ7_9VIBR|nr:hypothetical protein [Vibrio qingdaonensis]MCW8346783.1 hypothetical protein [Vibrio qingdaonensis]